MRLRLAGLVGALGRRRPAGLAAVLAAAVSTTSHAQSAAVPGAPAEVTAFVNVAVVPMDTERVLPDYTVLVEGGRITALGPTNQVQVPATARRIDGKGRYLIPGLADMHVHLRWGDDAEENMASMLRVFLTKGITTVRDMHSGESTDPDWFLEVKHRLATGQMLGPHLYTAGDPVPPQNVDLAAIGESVAELKAQGHDFIKFYWGTREEYDSIQAAATRVGIRIVGHVPQSVGLQTALAARWASIEHLMKYVNYLIGFDGEEAIFAYVADSAAADTAAWLQPTYKVDETKLREITVATQQAGVWNCPTLSVLEDMSQDMVRNYPPVIGRTGPRFFDLLLQVVKGLHDAGAGLLLGTDMALGADRILGAPNQYSIERELALLVRAGLTPYQALGTGTRDVARFMGTEDSAGTVAVGKWADLVLLKGNPLQDIRHTAAPVGTMIGGRWLPQADSEQRKGAAKPGSSAPAR